jgi:PE family
MSFVVVTPEMLMAAASQLEGTGSALSTANAAAAAAITRVAAAGQDEVSAAIASVLSEYAKSYQELSLRAAGFHTQFVQGTKLAAEQYHAVDAWFSALLAARRASRASLPSPKPDPLDTSPAGGGG